MEETISANSLALRLKFFWGIPYAIGFQSKIKPGTGKYNFRFEWTPEAGPCSGPADGATRENAAAPSSTPSIFTALQETLGLRLQSIKGPVDSLVITPRSHLKTKKIRDIALV
jgi:hypothetical protein